MRISIVGFIIFLINFTLCSQCFLAGDKQIVRPGQVVGGSSCRTADYNPTRQYKSVLSDEFNNVYEVNTSKWRTSYPYPAPFDRVICQAGGLERQLYYDDCPGRVSPCQQIYDPFIFTGSSIKIRAQHSWSGFNYTGTGESDSPPSQCPIGKGTQFSIDKFYSSGLLNSKIEFTYGKFEIRFKVSKARKAWPAFWLFGGGNEYDIFEIFDTQSEHDEILMSSHKYLPNDDRDVCRQNWDGPADFFVNRMNTVALVRTPSSVYWLLNGQKVYEIHRFFRNGQPVSCGTVNNTNSNWEIIENQHFTSAPMDVKANLAISDGGSNVHSYYPAYFEIDYIRVSQRTGNCEYANITGPSAPCSGYSTFQGDYSGGSNYSWSISGNGAYISGPSNRSNVSVYLPGQGSYFLTQTSYNSCEGRTVTSSKVLYVGSCGGGGYYRSNEIQDDNSESSNLLITDSQPESNLNLPREGYISVPENFTAFPNPVGSSTETIRLSSSNLSSKELTSLKVYAVHGVSGKRSLMTVEASKNCTDCSVGDILITVAKDDFLTSGLYYIQIYNNGDMIGISKLISVAHSAQN